MMLLSLVMIPVICALNISYNIKQVKLGALGSSAGERFFLISFEPGDKLLSIEPIGPAQDRCIHCYFPETFIDIKLITSGGTEQISVPMKGTDTMATYPKVTWKYENGQYLSITTKEDTIVFDENLNIIKRGGFNTQTNFLLNSDRVVLQKELHNIKEYHVGLLNWDCNKIIIKIDALNQKITSNLDSQGCLSFRVHMYFPNQTFAKVTLKRATGTVKLEWTIYGDDILRDLPRMNWEYQLGDVLSIFSIEPSRHTLINVIGEKYRRSFDVEDTTDILLTSMDASLKASNAGDICQIAGVCNSLEHEFPFFVALQSGGHGGKIKCGGTLINDHTVLTAAHCVPDESDITLHINPYDIRKFDPSRLRKPAKIIKHAKYVENDAVFHDYDIALIEFDPPVAMKDRNYVNILSENANDEWMEW